MKLPAQSDTWFFLDDGTLLFCAGKDTPEIESDDGAGAKAEAPPMAERQRTMLDESFMVVVNLKTLSGIWRRRRRAVAGIFEVE